MKNTLLVLTVAAIVVVSGCAGGNRPLQLLNGAGPVYPGHARTAGIEGYVVVQYDVTIEGRVVNATVVEAEPQGVFEQAALTAIRSWQFNPPKREGEAIAALGRRSTVTFELGDTSRYDEFDED